MHFEIDPEFQQLIPPLNDEEFSQLEANIIAEGCRDALVVWQEDALLLDGHNRYNICSANGIVFDVAPVSLPSREAAINWIIDNQLGRRNLTPQQASYLRGKRFNSEPKVPGKRNDLTSDHFDPRLPLADRLAVTHGVSPATIKRDAKYAASVDLFDPEVKREILNGKSEYTKQEVIEARGNVEALKTPHVAHNSGNNEWYTPKKYIEAARSVLGTIDLDPASSDRANEIIRAESFFTVDQDGLAREWRGNVFMNPPYSRIIERFAEKLVFHHLRGDVPTAIVLVNNATETEWFRRMAQASKAICFPYSRVRFWSPNGTPGQPLQGQAILYMGEQIDKFIDEFTPLGLLVKIV